MNLNAFHKIVVPVPGLLSKILFVMRITTFLLFVILMQVNAAGRAQRITLSEKNTTLRKVIFKIRQQSGYDFFYIKDNLKNARPVDIELKNATNGRKHWRAVFAGQPLAYELKNRVVVIKVKEKNLLDRLISVFTNVDVRGRIVDEKGIPIIGVSIKVKNTSRGTTTDAEGRFQLNLAKGDILGLSYIGFETQEIVYNNQPELNITLKELNSELGEVVVIGYGSVKQRNVTGAITQVKGTDLNSSVASSFQQTLQGKAAGVQVIQATGQPGAGVKVKIRSNPSFADAGVLYVIDGVPVNDAAGQPALGGSVGGSRYADDGVDKSPLNFINPNDIESIQFLKDASAASIYGARAGAGVVLITTKRGAEGKAKLEYTGSYGTQNADKMYEVFGEKEYMTQRNLLREERWYRDNKIAPYYGTVAAGRLLLMYQCLLQTKSADRWPIIKQQRTPSQEPDIPSNTTSHFRAVTVRPHILYQGITSDRKG